jgi:4-hydroxy 2-oxovalerate aldolase
MDIANKREGYSKAKPLAKRPIKLLDCTLRDGGHVNDWGFGEHAVSGIIHSLSMANIDIIELGLLKNTKYSKGATLQPCISAFAELAIAGSPRPEQYFTVMIRPDWIQASNIDDFDSHGIVKGIRFAFYPEDLSETLKQASIAKDRGYDIYLNAVGVSCYDIDKLISTIKSLVVLKPVALSIVDTFGAFDNKTLAYYYKSFEEFTDHDIGIGIHLHENRSLALSLAINFAMLKRDERQGILDASLFGMGRIPGNLCIEQIASVLNRDHLHENKYDLNHLMKGIRQYIYPIREKFKWGYSPEFMLSALKNVNRNYAEYFIDKNLALEDFSKALDLVQVLQGNSFRYSEEIANKALMLLLGT